MMDANQVWDVDEAIAQMRALARFDPWWIEEPTSPDDVLGHAAIARAIAPIRVATGEHVPEPRDLQAAPAGRARSTSARSTPAGSAASTRCSPVLLLAAKFGVPVCPHAGGVGLCEYVQHLAIFDYIASAARSRTATVEYVDHLHEHFVDPVRVVDGRYLAPLAPGYTIEMKPESLDEYEFPGGAVWAGVRS